MKKVEYSVTGMTCGGCSSGVRRALERMNGIQEATADHVLKKAVVVFDDKQVTNQEIIALIERLGYSAKVEHEEHTA